jgi:hypothetical protein
MTGAVADYQAMTQKPCARYCSLNTAAQRGVCYCTYGRRRVDDFGIRPHIGCRPVLRRPRPSCGVDKGRLIGAALYAPGGDPEVTASVHPLHRISRIELGAHVYDKGFEQANEMSMTAVFDDGDQISVDPGGMAIEWQRERTGSFIDAVLDAVGLATAEQ